MHSRAWVNTCGAMPCSCCRIRHCSSVTDMAVRSLALLQLVNRTPLRRRQTCNRNAGCAWRDRCHRMERRVARDMGSGQSAVARGQANSQDQRSQHFCSPTSRPARTSIRNEVTACGTLSVPSDFVSLPHVTPPSGCSFQA